MIGASVERPEVRHLQKCPLLLPRMPEEPLEGQRSDNRLPEQVGENPR